MAIGAGRVGKGTEDLDKPLRIDVDFHTAGHMNHFTYTN